MGEFQIPNDHQLWLTLSSVRERNIFAGIPELFNRILQEDMCEDQSLEDEFNFTLASDYEWRMKIYIQLLKKMRLAEELTGMPIPWGEEEEEVVPMHHWNIVPKPTKVNVCCPDIERLAKRESPTIGPSPITWTVSDIAKAAKLLVIPPLQTHFEDEQEMRRVYTLIYDTFRYKGILNRALSDIVFFETHPELESKNTLIWLLFFDLYHRSFRKREPAVVENARKLFLECGLFSLEEALWKQRIKLAAAIARLRIKHSALRLSELLPKHLRDERLGCQGHECPVTCWINPKKVKCEEEITTTLQKTLNLNLADKLEPLIASAYKWDIMCPNFVTFHHSVRSALAQSSLVQRHKLIVQDRSFCLGPATFGKIILDLELTGSVVQSHINSPRTTAYLATLLLQNSKITGLLAFSAGPRKIEYDSYFHELGMTNVSIYAEKLIDLPPDAICLDRVIAVFATPPNSYSAVSDPIDLVCSRGGDLTMLEVLTESEVSDEGKVRVAEILEEQRKTLKFAMSRPQIQLVLYETHSELFMENDGMVHRTIREINKLAKLKHAEIQGKLRVPSSHIDFVLLEQEINNNENLKLDVNSSEGNITMGSQRNSITSKQSFDSIDELCKDIVVPQCDLFDKPILPDLCPNADCCLRLSDEGCYLALLQRKEVTKLDNKYMIQMAEARGLFGTTSTTSGRTKGSRGSKTKKQEKRAASPTPAKTKRKTQLIEFDRIAAPTQASLRHSNHSTANGEMRVCPRHREEEEESLAKVPQSRRWWSETTRHITNLRQSLVNKKIIPPVKKSHSQPKIFTNSLMHATSKIDEVVAKSSENYNIPVFPRLRLSRNNRKIEKLPLPVTVTVVEFPKRIEIN